MLRKLLMTTAMAAALIAPGAAPAFAAEPVVTHPNLYAGPYWFRSQATGACLVGDFSATYTVSDCGIDNQYWFLSPLPNGYYLMANGATGRCLANLDSFHVYQTSCNSTVRGQLWDLGGLPNKGWLVSVNTGRQLCTDFSHKVYLAVGGSEQWWHWSPNPNPPAS
ncbi:hypothetical protein GCM10023322_09580 [Rugosimonospora acidiphila]|uniref:Ricin B lectin domain-containing protein n=1 Tax=Rugosimonospora acidiphila TaxID=556531 RepID=A0ABP9RKD1_9ACTN